MKITTSKLPCVKSQVKFNIVITLAVCCLAALAVFNFLSFVRQDEKRLLELKSGMVEHSRELTDIQAQVDSLHSEINALKPSVKK